MKKAVVKGLLIGLLLIAIVGLSIPFGGEKLASDGGSKVISHIFPWYNVWDLNEAHYDGTETYYIKGTRVEIFGLVVYEDTYEVR